MSLVSTIEALQKRPLTAEEINNIGDLQSIYQINDSDPLVIVLALMARSQLVVSTMPELLQQKVDHTIELHRTLLMEQSSLVSKQLILSIAQNLKVQGIGWRAGAARYAGAFVAGMVVATILFHWVPHWANI